MFIFSTNFIYLGKWKPSMSENQRCIHQFKAVERVQKPFAKLSVSPQLLAKTIGRTSCDAIGRSEGRTDERTVEQADVRTSDRTNAWRGRTSSSAILGQLPSCPRIQKIVFLSAKRALSSTDDTNYTDELLENV